MFIGIFSAFKAAKHVFVIFKTGSISHSTALCFTTYVIRIIFDTLYLVRNDSNCQMCTNERNFIDTSVVQLLLL